jgi:hypothetical protein
MQPPPPPPPPPVAQMQALSVEAEPEPEPESIYAHVGQGICAKVLYEYEVMIDLILQFTKSDDSFCLLGCGRK